MQSQMKADVTSNTAFNKDVDDMCALAKLPTELLWTIFEYAHESVSEFRLISRWFKSAVDNFASQQLAITLSEKIIFSLFEWQKAKIDVKIEIPRSKAQLYRLNRRLRQIQSLTRKGFEVIDYADNPLYYTSLNLKCENVDTNYVNNLIDCIGRKVGTVCIDGCHDGKASIAVARAIEHFHFKSFAFSVDTLSDNDVIFLSKLINDNQIEQLTLRVNDVSNSDPVRVLFDLSSRLNSLYLVQSKRIPLDNRVFGIIGGDWASIIREMFSRKLDTLLLYDQSQSTHLDDNIIKTLMHSLPNMGKRLWFSASFSMNPALKNKKVEYTDNNHIVKFESSHNSLTATDEEWLTIMHTSRADNYV